MLKQMKPLAISASVPSDIGPLHCFAIHDRVINLVNQQQQLITLHKSHNGISPMGYVLKADDFLYIKDILSSKTQTNILQSAQGIVIDDTLLTINARQLQLNVKHKFISSFAFVDPLVRQFNQQTGLFGCLKSINKDKLPVELQHLCEQILLFLNEQTYDLSSIIGLGPGLTPTGDDIITGILLMIHSDPFCYQLLSKTQPNFNLALLEQQTTKVSAHFLYYAAHGIFSANLLNVLHLIRCKKNMNLTAIDRLLDYGHTSGADIMLGIWLGSLILGKYKYG